MRCSAFAALALLAAASSLGAQPVDRSLVLQEFDIPTDGDALLVPVQIGDRKCRFIVDTGCSRTEFDTALRSSLGPPLMTGLMANSAGSVDRELFAFPPVFLGRMSVASDELVACVPMNELSTVVGQRIDGMVGMDVLCQYVVSLDFDRGKLAILKEAARQHGIRVPFRDPRTPTIDAKLPGLSPTRLLIDTGCIALKSGSIFAASLSRLERQANFTVVGYSRVLTASGQGLVRKGRISKCSIAGFDFADTIWSEHKGHIAGYVSLYFLTQFNVTFDFPNSVMYLEKSKNFRHADLIDLSGLHFRRIEDQVVIESVDDNSPAERCGIRAGDVIRALGSHDARTARLFVLRKSLCEARGRIPLVLQRGSQRFERELVLPEPTAVSR